MFVSGMCTAPSAFSYCRHGVPLSQKPESAANDGHVLDSETSGEKTKVRLWWHEHWQARYSSKEAEEEVNVPTQISRV